MKSVKKYLAWAKIFFDRGRDWLSLIQFLMVASIFSEILRAYLHLDFIYFFVITAVFVFSVSLGLGFLDLKYGIYRLEFERRAYVNPFWAKSRVLWETTLDKVRTNQKTIDSINNMVKNHEGKRSK